MEGGGQNRDANEETIFCCFKIHRITWLSLVFIVYASLVIVGLVFQMRKTEEKLLWWLQLAEIFAAAAIIFFLQLWWSGGDDNS